jgi:hypothetical protein
MFDTVTLTCHVALSSQSTMKIYLTLLSRVEHVTFAVQSLIFSVCCTSVNSRARYLLTSLTKIANSCYRHVSTYKIIDTVTLTGHVALSSQLTMKVYFTLLSRVEHVTFAAQSLPFSVCCMYACCTSVNSRTRNLLTPLTKIASSCYVHTFATTLMTCHASNSLIFDTITPACYAALLSPLTLNVFSAMITCTEYVTLKANLLILSASCTSDNLRMCNMPTRFIVIASSIILGCSDNILIVNLSYSYNP